MPDLDHCSCFPGSRVLRLFGRIDPTVTNKLRDAFLQLDSLGNHEITLLIDSPGGDITPTLDLFNVIKLLRSEVRGLVVGECSSAALVLLQSCERRIACKESRFLYHSWTANRSFRLDADANVDFERWINERMRSEHGIEEMILARAKMNSEQLRVLKKSGDIDQLFFGSQKAYELGLIDAIADENTTVFT